MKLTAYAAIFAIISLTFCGCISRGAYHFAGTTLPENQRKIALNEFINATSEARLTPLLKNALSEKLENTPSIDVVSESHAGLLVALKLESLDQRSAARAQMRDTADRKDDGDAYQSVLYRIELKVSYIARSTDGAGTEYKGAITATADVPMMPDHEMSLQTALRQVAIDAAAKLASAITER